MQPTALHRTPASTSLRRPAWLKSLMFNIRMLVSLHLHDATETPSVDRGGARVSFKLEPLVVRLRLDATYNLAPCPRHVQHVKSAFGGPNARLRKLGPLKTNSPNAKVKPLRLVKRERHAAHPLSNVSAPTHRAAARQSRLVPTETPDARLTAVARNRVPEARVHAVQHMDASRL